MATPTETMQQWAACALNADIDGWAELNTDAMTYTHSNSMHETRADVVAAFNAGRRYSKLAFEDTNEALYGDAAVVTGIARVVVERDPPLNLNLRFTATLVAADDEWRVAAYQTTPLQD